MGELSWGRRYLMCPPHHFGVLYEIGPEFGAVPAWFDDEDPCTADADCDDGLACSVDVCLDGECATDVDVARSERVPLARQEAADPSAEEGRLNLLRWHPGIRLGGEV